MPAVEAWQRGESPVKAIAENLPFAALPFLHRGRTGERGAANVESSLGLERSPEYAGERTPQPVPFKAKNEAQSDPMADALAEVKIHRAAEPYAGPPEFRGMAEGDLYDLASRRPRKGTARQKRLELIRSQAAAIAEIDRRQNEAQSAEIEPPDTGIRAASGDVPSFQDYVENRPAGGLRFESLEAGSPDFNRLAGEYVERYGTRPRTVRPQSEEPAQALRSITRTEPTAAATPGLPAEPPPQLTRESVALPQPKKETPAPPRIELPQIEPRTVGRESQAVTERGSEINTRYAVVDLDSLITSHDSALRPNPDFPPELQPRERDRAASADQISRIASNLRPDFLGESPKASEGAPIVGPDGIVESGNGRVLGLRQAYESGNRGAQAYRAFILENAERFGLDRSELEGVKSPVLVRVRTTKVNRQQIVKEANEQS